MATARNTKLSVSANEGSLGKNVNYSLDANGVLTIRIDLNVTQGLSATGKSQIVATTSGNKSIPNSGDTMIGLNLYRRV